MAGTGGLDDPQRSPSSVPVPGAMYEKGTELLLLGNAAQSLERRGRLSVSPVSQRAPTWWCMHYSASRRQRAAVSWEWQEGPRAATPTRRRHSSGWRGGRGSQPGEVFTS